MVLAVMQPTYIPWIGYYDLIDQADKFVIYDDVQFSKQSWQVRNRIRDKKQELFLTIPVIKSKLDTKINEVKIDNKKSWKKKHLKSIYFNYIKSGYFEEIYSFLESIYNKNYDNLSDLNNDIIVQVCKKIGITTTFFKSSALKSREGAKDERLVNLCKELECGVYLSTKGAAVYLEKDTPGGKILVNDISLYYHNYEHPIYQQTASMFIPYLSIIDLLFNVGFGNSLDVIRSGRGRKISCQEFRLKYLTES